MLQYSSFFAMFLTIFLAEIGDKSQLSTVLFASHDGRSPWLVFFAVSSALLTATAIAVLAGHYAARYLDGFPLKLIAGMGFMMIGSWTIYEHFKA